MSESWQNKSVGGTNAKYQIKRKIRTHGFVFKLIQIIKWYL